MSDVMMADLPYSKSVSISNLPVCEFLNSRTPNLLQENFKNTTFTSPAFNGKSAVVSLGKP